MKKIEKAEKSKSYKAIIVVSIIGLLFSVIIYSMLIATEKSILEDYDTEFVLISKEKIAKGTQLDESLFEKIEVNVENIPENSITSIGKEYAVCDISKNTMITKDMLNEIEKAYNGEQEVGICCKDLANCVNGTLRTSDYVNIYVLNREAVPLFKHIYVTSVYDINGISISNSDKDSIVNNFNVILKEEEVNRLFDAIQTGSVFVSIAR